MVRRAFSIAYDPDVIDHLRAIERNYNSLIRREIEMHLSFEPNLETRNRKPLIRAVDFDADWELRFGPDNRFRVFYAISHDLMQVQILAIGEKRGNRLFIGGEEIEI